MRILAVVLGSLLILLAACGARSNVQDNVWKPGDKPILLLTPGEIFKDKRLRQLAEAAQHGDIKEIDNLVAKGVNVNGHGKYGIGPLFSAWQAGNKDGFKTLLVHGANPNNVWSTGDTLLNLIAETADPYFLKLALSHGADPNLIAPRTGITPIFTAVDPMAPDDSPIQPDGRENVSLLMQAGANINYQTRDGETPLIAAAVAEQYGVVLQLLTVGADLRLKMHNDRGLVDYVKRGSRILAASDPQYQYWLQVVQFLRSKGVNINVEASDDDHQN
ncbi:MAG: ankyrin repeat domain-containing protein [Gammaproteobacteria bacterium]